MKMLLALTILAMVLVSVGLIGMYINVCSRIADLEDELKSHKAEISKHKKRIKVLETREVEKSDRVVIMHSYENKNAPEYGGF